MVPEGVPGNAGTAGTAGNVWVSCAITEENTIGAKYINISLLCLHLNPTLSQIYTTVRLRNSFNKRMLTS